MQMALTSGNKDWKAKIFSLRQQPFQFTSINSEMFYYPFPDGGRPSVNDITAVTLFFSLFTVKPLFTVFDLISEQSA